MVRLADLHPDDRANLAGKRLPRFDPPAFVPAPPPCPVEDRARHHRGPARARRPTVRHGEHRVPRHRPRNPESRHRHEPHVGQLRPRGFAEDVNVVFPVDRFRELQVSGAIGSMANVHYSFMGAYLEPGDYAPSARELAALLRGDGVDSVFLHPGVTELHARRERAVALPGDRRAGDYRNQPRARARRGDGPAALALGLLPSRPPARRRRRCGVSASGDRRRAGTARPAGGAGTRRLPGIGAGRWFGWALVLPGSNFTGGHGTGPRERGPRRAGGARTPGTSWRPGGVVEPPPIPPGSRSTDASSL